MDARPEEVTTGQTAQTGRQRPAILPTGVTLAALLVTADAAVETMWSGSALRWWIGPAALLLVALNGWGWRPGGRLWARWGPTGAASSSVLALLLLLAVSAWLPGGQSDGVRLLRQPTAVVLAAVSALAVAVAGFSLVRVKVGPWWLRAAFGGLALYGVAAFATGMVRGTAFPSLLSGQSLWTRLPFYLQGAFVGGLVLLPAGLIVSVVGQGLRFARHAESGRWTRHEAVALAVCLAMTVAGVVVPGGTQSSGTRRSPSVAPAGPPPVSPRAAPPADVRLELPAPPGPEPTAEQVQARYDRLTQQLPETRYYPAVQARALGPNVESLFMFVRDRIRYEAYSGILRGPGGTLAGLAGNSFDRSLLLVEMLEAHGVRTRLVRGELPAREAEALFARMFESPAAAQAGAQADGPGAAPGIAFWARVTARARRDYSVVRAAIGNSMPVDGQAWREQTMRDIRRHVWVQAEVSGRWLDLDTSFAGSTPGEAHAAPAQTVDRAPNDWHQHVTVRVLAERLEDGALKRTTALEVTLPAVDLVDQEVFLVHVPEAAGGGGMGLGVAGGAGRKDRWAPALLVGEGGQTGRPVSFGGSEASGGFLGSLGGGGASASDFVAEWLEFEVQRPDGRRDTTRRALVDRATAAWRASASHEPDGLSPLAADKDGPIAPRAIRNIWFSAGPHNLRGYAESVMNAAASEPDPSEPMATQLLPLATSNFAALVWADHAALPAVNDLPHVRLYTDSPRIVIVSVVPSGDGGAIEEYDLRRDSLWGVARDASSDGLVFDRKIWYAAIEGALEHEAVAASLARNGGDASTATSTSSLLTAQGVVLLRPGEADRIGEMTRDPEKAAKLGAALRRGSFAVVPKAVLESGPCGWWDVGPGGDTRAVLEEDVHASRGITPGPFNSDGGIKATRYGAKVWEVRMPEPKVKPRNPVENFGKDRPRPKKEEARGGTEYALVTALMAIASLMLIGYVANGMRKHYQRMAEFDALDAAAAAGR